MQRFWVNRISASGNLCHWSVSMIAIYTYYLRSCKWSLVGSYLKCLYWNENLLHLCTHTVTKCWAIRHFDACSGGNPAAERHLVWRPLVSTSLLPQATSGHPFSLLSSPLGQLQQVGGTCNARIASSSGTLPRSLYNIPRAVAFDAFLSEFFDPFAIPRFMSCESIRVQRIVWPVKAYAPDRGDVLWPVCPYVSFYFYSFLLILLGNYIRKLVKAVANFECVPFTLGRVRIRRIIPAAAWGKSKNEADTEWSEKIVKQTKGIRLAIAFQASELNASVNLVLISSRPFS